MSDYEYIIVGDADGYKECLVYTCGTKDNAERVLERIKNNPTDSDKHILKGYSNLKVKKVHKDSCWWRNGCD